MNWIDMMVKELEQEARTTRKMLDRVPADKFDWKPHTKSMSLKSLALHVAELPGWPALILTTDELDFAKTPYEQPAVSSAADVVLVFEKALEKGKRELQKATEAQMKEAWTMRNGEEIYSSSPKVENIRGAFCQTVHHRAQLGVYLRLLDIPIPASYGPSADDMSF